MKHLEINAARSLAESLLDELDLRIGADVLEAVLVHLDGVLDANTRVNLTRITEPSDAVRLHVVDSLVALPEVAASPDGILCDMGSGPGFPGIPLALATSRQAVLLESVRKKAAQVSELLAAEHLDAQIAVIAERAETHATERRGAYSVVTARALSALPALVELASPLLAVGGRLVCLKGSPDTTEIASGDAVAAQTGMARASTRTVALPGGAETRTIITYVRSGKPKVHLPRREGMAQRSPLA